MEKTRLRLDPGGEASFGWMGNGGESSRRGDGRSTVHEDAHGSWNAGKRLVRPDHWGLGSQGERAVCFSCPVGIAVLQVFPSTQKLSFLLLKPTELSVIFTEWCL